MSPGSSRLFCSDEARRERDPLPGTASRATRWVAIEVPPPWGRRAVEEDPVADDLRAWIDRVQQEVPTARVVFVHRPDRATGTCRVYVAGAEERRQVLRGGELGGPSEIARRLPVEGLDTLDVDLPVVGNPLLLVCGNARRDRCCARRGLPVFDAVQARPGGVDAWLSTHLGGHRHAAVALVLPLGIQYGFLSAEDVPGLLRATVAGELLLDHFRGRTFYPPVVQAADVFVRRELGLTEAGAVRWRPVASDLANGAVSLAVGEEIYRVIVRQTPRDALVSCGPPKHKEIQEISLEEIGRERQEVSR